MSNDALIANLADIARRAARSLRVSSYQIRQSALLAIASGLNDSRNEILAANKEDVERERAAGLSNL